ncbi:MAG: TonB-dependent receptor [Novosphingobium sp.]|nr:TonB-dependent receptor [Novosphingobium sp.]
MDTKSHRIAMLLGCTALAVPALGLSPSAWGQTVVDAAPQETLTNEDAAAIIVTGSRIRGIAPTGSAVTALSTEDITRSGSTTTADVLRQVPQITSIGINGESLTAGAQGASNITRANAPNLRGIGPTATLTLLDGHRVSTAGTQGQLVDPSFLPPLALERLEVIADGASAIYGSDAVAGVVNLIPRKNYQGLELTGRGAIGRDYHDWQVGGLAGTRWNTGHVVFAVDYLSGSRVEAADRDFITDDRRGFGGTNGLGITCSPGNVTVNSGSGARNYALPAGDGRNLQFAQLTPGTTNECDLVTLNTIVPKTTRLSLYGYADQELFEGVTLFAQGFYTRRTFESTRTQPFVQAIAVPASNPFRPAGIPAGSSVSVNYSLVPDLGRGPANGNAEVYQIYSGLDAKAGAFKVRLSGSYGRGSDIEKRKIINPFELARALADPNPATAFNPFGGPGSNNPATLAQIYSANSSIGGTSTLKTLELNADGPLFDLPGGSVRVAVGGEVRWEKLTGRTTNVSNATGLPTVSTSANDRVVKAAYAEVFVPIFGPENAMPGFQSLALSLAGRIEDYNDFGSTANPKIGLTWQPLDGLSLRGSFGTSFRAPGLSENDPLGSGSAISTQTRTLPATITVNGTTLAAGTRIPSITLRGGNPDLRPETATTWSAGFDLTPTSLPGLRLSVTYFDILYKNQIVDGNGRLDVYLRDPALFADLITFQGASNFAAFREFFETSGVPANAALNYNQANLALINARRVNVGQVDTNGIDFDIGYELETGLGDFSLRAVGTRFLKYKTTELGQPTFNRLNTIYNPPKLRGRAMLTWEKDGFSSQLTANYTNSYTNNLSTLVTRVPSYTTFDLDLGYAFGEGGGLTSNMRIGLNARNMFDRKPPLVDVSGAYDASVASALGRVVALTLSKSF